MSRATIVLATSLFFGFSVASIIRDIFHGPDWLDLGTMFAVATLTGCHLLTRWTIEHLGEDK